MKNLFLNTSCFLSFSIFLLGCSYGYHGIGTYSGPALIESYTVPLESYQSINNDVLPIVKGKSCVSNIIGIAKFGNASIAKSMMDYGISKVHSVATVKKNILRIYASECVVVFGEKGSIDEKKIMAQRNY